ncbi:tyrosine-protein phosphatase [Kitasatospora sp. NPDC049285]|uniref:tyrosine-protein phosphatase n=1 Tax=Kitasatospora sp. NPDC049285 TaxID=3157096 RepID=UPI00343663FA
MTDRELDAAPFLAIPDVPNFRDAGAGVFRPGLLYRSATLNRLTEEGAAKLKELGVRTVVDLRSSVELDHWPDRLHGLDVDYRHLPLLPDPATTDRAWPEDQAALYPFMAEVGGVAIAGAVRALAAGGPVVVHCAVGKDRTGLTIAVLQSLAGLPAARITEDFVRSNTGLGLDGGPIPYTDEAGVERLSRPVAADHLHSALTRIQDLHGSLESYLLAHGTTEEELTTLRTLGPA